MGLYDEPASAVLSFVGRAKRRGHYSQEQARLCRMAVRVLERAAQTAIGRRPTTVRDVVLGLDAIGQLADLSENSRRTYESRARKVVRDFLELADKPDSSWHGRDREEVRPAQMALGLGDNWADAERYQLLLPGGRRGELQLPPNLTITEARSLVRQLEAITALLSEQASATEPAPAKGGSS